MKMNKNENGEGSQAYLYIRIVKKNAWFFKQQTESFLVSSWHLLKVFLFLAYFSI